VLDPAHVAASVWDAITGLLGRPRWSLIAPQVDTMLLSAEPMYRADKLFDPTVLATRAPDPAAPRCTLGVSDFSRTPSPFARD
jgi:hypothetical protein